MFTFAWGVYTSLFAEPAYKVLIIGLESSGKTTLMEQIKYTYSERNNSTNTNSNSNNNDDNNNTSGEAYRGITGIDIPTVAPISVMSKKRIRPTVGLNMARVTHRTIPPQLYYTLSQRRSVSRDSVNSDCRTSSVSVSGISTTYTPINTRLTLWDVGGALRGLWANYFSSCHGVIFVVDSTLAYSASASSITTTNATITNTHTSTGNNNNNDNTNGLPSNSNNNNNEMESLSPSQSRTSCDDSGMATLSLSNGRGLATVLEHPINVSKQNGMTIPSSPYSDNDNDEKTERKQLQRKAYAENAAILREVFCHPLLSDAPLLIVSNKSDLLQHAPLEEIQDALGLVEMALMHHVYDDYHHYSSDDDDDDNNDYYEEEKEKEKNKDNNNNNNNKDNNNSSTRQKSHSVHSEEYSDGLAASLTSTSVAMIPGTSGIGTKIMRLAEISAMDGTGVREAMDWLVVQMRESKRVPETKDE